MSKEPSGWALVTLDYHCPVCKTNEERVVSQDKRKMQDCTKCGATLAVQFPLGNQLAYEFGSFKPFMDDASPACKDLGEKWITSKTEWHQRVRHIERQGYKQGHKGNGYSISREHLKEAEKRARKIR